MQQKQITTNELVRKMEDAYGKYVCIMCENEDFTSTDTTDDLEVYADDKTISFRNCEGIEYNIKLSSIRMISLSRILDSLEIKIQLGNSKVNLLICD